MTRNPDSIPLADRWWKRLRWIALAAVVVALAVVVVMSFVVFER